MIHIPLGSLLFSYPFFPAFLYVIPSSNLPVPFLIPSLSSTFFLFPPPLPLPHLLFLFPLPPLPFPPPPPPLRLPPSVRSREGEVKYLSNLVDALLPVLMPRAAKENECVNALLREILVMKCLLPAIDALADPDILNYIGNMRERYSSLFP